MNNKTLEVAIKLQTKGIKKTNGIWADELKTRNGATSPSSATGAASSPVSLGVLNPWLPNKSFMSANKHVLSVVILGIPLIRPPRPPSAWAAEVAMVRDLKSLARLRSFKVIELRQMGGGRRGRDKIDLLLRWMALISPRFVRIPMVKGSLNLHLTQGVDRGGEWKVFQADKSQLI